MIPLRRSLPVVALVAATTAAHAGGLQLATRGVRPSARAGAFVAGADDLGALWFNPAGLATMAGGHETRGFLFDVAYVTQSAEYTRVDSGNNQQDPVSNSAPGLPVPTVGVAFDVGDKLTIAGGVYAPYAALGKYPEDGAQRYSLIDMSESLLVIMELAVGYKVNDKLRIGGGIQNMVFSLAATMVFSGCPGETICAPEDPEFDALTKVKQLDAFNPSAVIGVQYDVSPKLTVGAAFQLPFQISGSGSFQSRLPSAAFYDGATIEGDRADVSFTLPAMFRAGLEVRPNPRWRVELGMSMEMWSMHDQFTIEPRDVRIEGAPGVGTYELSDMIIKREFENSLAFMIGVEGKPLQKTPLTVLAGYSYETAAAPDEYLTVLTVDGNKHLVSAGFGYRAGKFDINAVIGMVKVADRTVANDVGMSEQLTPIRDDPNSQPLDVYVNWGDYKSSWLFAGLGVTAPF